MTDRTIHAETGYAEVVRYDRAGIWRVEAKPGALSTAVGRQRMSLGGVVEWLQDQESIGESVTVHYGRTGGLQFDKRARAALEAS